MKLPFFVNLYISCLCDPPSVWNKLPFNPFCKVVWFSFYSFDSVFSVPCIKVFCSWNSGFFGTWQNLHVHLCFRFRLRFLFCFLYKFLVIYDCLIGK